MNNQPPIVRSVLITHDVTNSRAVVQTTVSDYEEIIETLSEGIIMVLRGAHQSGDTKGDTQKRLDGVKMRIWSGLVDKYDDPDLHIHSGGGTTIHPTQE